MYGKAGTTLSSAQNAHSENPYRHRMPDIKLFTPKAHKGRTIPRALFCFYIKGGLQ